MRAVWLGSTLAQGAFVALRRQGYVEVMRRESARRTILLLLGLFLAETELPGNGKTSSVYVLAQRRAGRDPDLPAREQRSLLGKTLRGCGPDLAGAAVAAKSRDGCSFSELR